MLYYEVKYMIKNRNGNIIVTNEKQNKLLEKLYGTIAGRAALKLLTAPVVSKAAGKFMDSPLSVPMIKRFIKNNNIDMSQYEAKHFSSYNDFFTRKVRTDMRPVDLQPEHLISPCDSKLTVYKISDNSVFRIKDSYYRISDLLRSRKLSERFRDGYCLIFRLEVDDYHRYCYIDNGSEAADFFIKGELHTVNPIALEHYNIYKRNSRECTVMQTHNFGTVVQVEVGAMMVGRILNHHNACTFKRGQEKGMFQFGGSTIVMLFEKDAISPDDDILRNSADGFETVVKYGEKIGTAVKNK